MALTMVSVQEMPIRLVKLEDENGVKVWFAEMVEVLVDSQGRPYRRNIYRRQLPSAYQTGATNILNTLLSDIRTKYGV